MIATSERSTTASADSDQSTPLSQFRTYALRTDALVLLAVMGACAVGVGALLRIGWIPSDEGTLAQSALRVYRGQLPHRDFAEIYTGGLSVLHAVAFHLFGVNLFSLRIMAFLFFLAWLPAVYYIARRFLAPLGAAAVTLTAVSWSYPNYVAAMPSWYNLFCATFGAAALLRYLDLERRPRRWLFLAGVCGGASLLVKVTGLYYIAAVLLFLLYLEQSHSATIETGPPILPRRKSTLYRIVCACALVLYLALLTRMIWPQLGQGELYHFLLPSAACVALLLARELRPSAASSRERFASLLRLMLPFLLGIALVVGVFLVPYAASGSVGALLHGIARSTGARMVGLAGQQHASGLIYVADYGLVVIAVIVFAMYSRWSRSWLLAGIVAVGLAAVVYRSAHWPRLQDFDLWQLAGTLTPLAVILGVALIAAGPQWGAGSPLAEHRVILLISLAAVCSLVQYPLPYITYFFYTAPLTLLAIVASVFSLRRKIPGKPVLAVLLLFFLAFGLLVMVPKHAYNPDLDMHALHPLQLPRSGNLRIDATTPGYEQLIPFLQSHSANGLIYAGNDCPEIYFLSGLRNPTRDDTGAPEADVLAALRSGKLRLVAINDQPFFRSGEISPQFRAAVQGLLPNTLTMGRFTIYWR